MENFSTSATGGSQSKTLPDFASAMANYYPTPSPADSGVSGVMSPMTPLSNYTQGSTPEQAFMTSPEHLNYAFESSEMPNTTDSPYSSDEGVVMSKCSQFYPQYDQHWTMSNPVCTFYFFQSLSNQNMLSLEK